MARTALISGAGVAGCCLAWWLARAGFEVTLLEQAPEPRKGGYVIDFWGDGYDIAERMGLLPALQQQATHITQFRVVDADNHRISGMDQSVFGRLAGHRYMSLPRSALARALYDAASGRVETLFGDSIQAMQDDGAGVAVMLGGSRRRFDLVFGADGLHSNVRRLVFGPEDGFESYLGYYAAAFTAYGYQPRSEGSYTAYGVPGRQIARIALSGGRTVFLLVFAQDKPLDIKHDDHAAHRALLRERFSGIGWESAAILERLDTCDDLYCDRVSQIVMPCWTRGRVALLGDACACPSLLAGQGSALAMVEAYVLAGELKAACDDFSAAFTAYQSQLQPFLTGKQAAARSFARDFVPSSHFGLWLRNMAMNLLGLPFLAELAFGGQLRDRYRLKDY